MSGCHLPADSVKELSAFRPHRSPQPCRNPSPDWGSTSSVCMFVLCSMHFILHAFCFFLPDQQSRQLIPSTANAIARQCGFPPSAFFSARLKRLNESILNAMQKTGTLRPAHPSSL